MKIVNRFMLLLICASFLAACASTNDLSDEQEGRYQRKIYLTEEDYMEDLDKAAQAERREAKPNTESQYLFDVQPDTQKNVYFFDYRTRPMVPGEPMESDYKKTKRLWEKPRRYSPEEYYAGQSAADTSSSSSSSYSSSDDYDSDY